MTSIHQAAYTSFPADSAEALLLSLPRPLAVVGNGAPARDFGALIDRYASVIRINNYVLAGFEQQVGSRTTLRVTSGWIDIEPRGGGVPELSPFHPARPESSNLTRYEAMAAQRVCVPVTDIGMLLPRLAKPSTGIALLALCSRLGIEVDAFCFDGFRSGHYWDGLLDRGVHSSDEHDVLLGLPGVTLMGPSYDYASLYDFCHSEHVDYNVNEGLRLYQQLGIELTGERILEFGAGNGGLSRHLELQGNRVTAVEVSEVAFQRIPVADKLLGDCLDLALVPVSKERCFDRFVSMDVLEHLTENDIRIVVREAARLCRSLLVSVSTRPSGLLGPHGENLHLTVRSVQWWLETLGVHFKVSMACGVEVGQVIFEGYPWDVLPMDQRQPAQLMLPLPPRLPGLGLPPGYRHRARPEYYVDAVERDQRVTWQPDVYPFAAELARSFGCTTLIDIGCGHARKLMPLSREFDIIGVDFSLNIAHCRQQYKTGVWLEADLETPLPLPIPRRVLAKSVVICSDVIEHLVDPLALLALLAHMLKDSAAVVLSTPDRVRTHGTSHAGPPLNTAHTREWQHEELGRLLQHAGFEVAVLSHTRSNDAQPAKATVLAVLSNRNHEGVRRSAPEAGAVPRVPAQPESAGRVAPLPAETAAATAAADTLAEVDALEQAHRDDGRMAVLAAQTRAAVGEWAGSLASARRAVGLSPGDADAWVALARASEALGQVQDFEAAMERALSLQERHPGALRFLAALYLREGQPSEAARIYDMLIDSGSADADVVEGAVLSHWRSGNVTAAAFRLLQSAQAAV